jgi:hypothetical protein
LGNRYDIRAIPTYILFVKEGGEINQIDTVISAHKEKIRRLFEKAFNIKNNK